MLDKAYHAQCAAVNVHSSDPVERGRCRLTLLSLALGSFCIGTSEFASMGILQLFSESLEISIPTATNAVTAYAFGVVIGAPLVTLAAARLNRRTLLLMLMAQFVLGNVLSGLAANLEMFALARFISGMPQGAYFGAGAVVATYVYGPGHTGKAFALVMMGLTIATIVGSPLATLLGQTVGWRNTYFTVSGLGVLSFLALMAFVPKTAALNGSSVIQELSALRKGTVWMTMLVTALGVASIFAIYTFVGPLITDVAMLEAGWIPIALAVFGIGMTAGNFLGGRLADVYPARGLLLGFGVAVVVLAALATFGFKLPVLFAGFFLVGATMFTAIPTIQVRLTKFAPEAPTLVGAMNLAALNLSNAIGAWSGGLAIANGFGILSAAWAGFCLTLAGLVIFTVTLTHRPRLATA
ncbi:MFS transporter [Rhizobium sp. YK2]|uniref:MFS transporter n=1 Tax=Rhizobium sp. YK2 TaxID=1860096 RepID=UPI00084C0B7E|nr:MFS transporter [Rhizobium sp. YK2]OED00863.1 permease [Rhizobium sp. YK2]